MGAPPNQCRMRRSPNQYTSYMDLMSELVETKPSSFKEAVEQIVWVDSMVEEYESILKKSVWEVVPRLVDKSVVGSIWIFEVMHVVYGRIEKYKDRFVAKGYSQAQGIDYEETFSLIAIRKLYIRKQWKTQNIIEI